ncbi:MAG: ATP synthase F1 subunit delta [Sandaracinaceae bacterium]|nr:ATP synthase F1 subunit delta [Sandaracinaceae bacterium]
MIGGAVGKRYATALHELAAEKGAADAVGKDLASLRAAWETSEDLRNVVRNPQFGAEAKRNVVSALTDRLGCHTIVKNAMRLLADRGRLEHLPSIVEAYERIAEARAGRIRAEVVTAKALPEPYYQQLVARLAQATGKDVVLVRREDPSLIGGVVTTVGGRVFDGSLKHRLAGLRAQLLASTDPALAAER